MRERKEKMRTIIHITDGEKIEPNLMKLPRSYALDLDNLTISFGNLEQAEHFVELLKIEIAKQQENTIDETYSKEKHALL